MENHEKEMEACVFGCCSVSFLFLIINSKEEHIAHAGNDLNRE